MPLQLAKHEVEFATDVALNNARSGFVMQAACESIDTLHPVCHRLSSSSGRVRLESATFVESKKKRISNDHAINDAPRSAGTGIQHRSEIPNVGDTASREHWWGAPPP